MKLVIRVTALVAIIGVMGCSGINISRSISGYHAVANQVELGDSKEKVLSILLPTQSKLPNSATKAPDQYIREGEKVEIFYMRSGRQPDGLTTDDEFVPYIFIDEKLVGIGWHILGGAKSHGKVIPKTEINTTTIIEQ